MKRPNFLRAKSNWQRICIVRVMKAAVGLGCAGAMVVGTAEPASASWYNDLLADYSEQIDCAATYGPWTCGQAQHAANWAHDVMMWRFNHNGHNDMTDAFRHCVWMGALATRVGQPTAIGIGELHERHVAGPEEELLMDLWNNWYGSSLGQMAADARLDDQWGYVLHTCESGARNFHLYGLSGIKGNY